VIFKAFYCYLNVRVDGKTPHPKPSDRLVWQIYRLKAGPRTFGCRLGSFAYNSRVFFVLSVTSVKPETQRRGRGINLHWFPNDRFHHTKMTAAICVDIRLLIRSLREETRASLWRVVLISDGDLSSIGWWPVSLGLLWVITDKNYFVYVGRQFHKPM